MIRFSIPSAALTITLAIACNNASDDQRKIGRAQAEANDRIGTADKEANQKIQNAQQDEDKKIADARADFMKLREDYRHTTTVNLVELDHHVDDLGAKAKASIGKTKTNLDAALMRIRIDRGVFENDYKALETTTPASWDDARSRLDTEWTRLKALVDHA
jgi:regulator of protease activity HflC (stomatin/prohibitin superfamily)